MKTLFVIIGSLILALGVFSGGAVLGTSLAHNNVGKSVVGENTQLLQASQGLIQKAIALDEQLQKRTTDLNKLHSDYDQLFLKSSQLEKQVKEFQAQNNCIKASVLAISESGFIYQTGESEICGTNLHFGDNIYGPNFETFIKDLQGEVDLLKQKCGDLCK